jgi:hypothetical protein
MTNSNWVDCTTGKSAGRRLSGWRDYRQLSDEYTMPPFDEAIG